MVLEQVFSFIATALSLYMVCLSIVIILSWFPGAMSRSPFFLFFSKIAEPYFRLFRRIPGLRIGFVDLSPIVGFLILSILIQAFSTLASAGVLGLGTIVVIVLSYLWSLIRFMLTLLILAHILRILSLTVFIKWGASPMWRFIDSIARKFHRLFVWQWRKSHIPRYLNMLMINTLYLGFYILVFYYLVTYLIQLSQGL